MPNGNQGQQQSNQSSQTLDDLLNATGGLKDFLAPHAIEDYQASFKAKTDEFKAAYNPTGSIDSFESELDKAAKIFFEKINYNTYTIEGSAAREMIRLFKDNGLHRELGHLKGAFSGHGGPDKDDIAKLFSFAYATDRYSADLNHAFSQIDHNPDREEAMGRYEALGKIMTYFDPANREANIFSIIRDPVGSVEKIRKARAMTEEIGNLFDSYMT